MLGSRHRRSCSWFLALVTAFGGTACGTGAPGTANDSPEPIAADAVAVYESRSEVPTCNPSRAATVYYVEDEDHFYYCDGRLLRPLDIDGAPGADGETWLVEASAALATECANGGIVVRVGPDTNDNGSLDSDEVASTDAVCNGADGKDGKDGKDGADGEDGADGNGTPLVRTTAEPPGENCLFGGNRVDVGVDRDEDGTLDDGEVTSSDFACHLGAYEGNLVLSTQAEVNRASSYNEIRGTLTVTGSVTDLAPLGNLVDVVALTIRDAPALTDVDYPSLLSHIDGLTIANNPALVSLTGVSNLVTASDIRISACPELTNVEFSGLESVSLLHVSDNASLTSLELPALARAHTITLATNALSHLDFGALIQIARLEVREENALKNLDGFGALLFVGTDLEISNNAALESLAGLDALESVVDDLSIQSNPSLVSLDLGNLHFVGDQLTIQHNSQLSLCEILAFTSHVAVEGDALLLPNRDNTCF